MPENIPTWFIEAEDVKLFPHIRSPGHQSCAILATVRKCFNARNDCQMFVNPSIPKEKETQMHRKKIKLTLNDPTKKRKKISGQSLVPACIQASGQRLLNLSFTSNGHSEGQAQLSSLGGVEGIMWLTEVIQGAHLEYSSNALVHCWENWQKGKNTILEELFPGFKE